MMRTELRGKKNNFLMLSADLTLLSFLCEDITDQSLLKNFLFDEEMPKASDWERLVILCPGRKNVDIILLSINQ